MASPSRKAASSSIDFRQDEATQYYDAELDFYSSSFNPERALWSDGVSVPYPDIKSFSSVDSYEEAVRSRQSRRKHSRQSKTDPDGSPGHRSSSSRSLDRHSKTDNDRHGSPKHRSSSSTSRSFDHHSKSDRRGGSPKPGGSISRVLDSRQRSLKPSERERSREKTSTRASTTTTRHRTSDSESLKWKTEKPSTSFPNSSSSRDLKGNQTHIEKEKLSLAEKPADDGEGSSGGNRSKFKEKRNVLTRMELMTGPLALLDRCVREKLQVRVMTRSAVTVRGICRGYIVAFDKYYNMAMIDVDEIYRRPACWGKVRARRSHKLLAAQKTLKKEREQQQLQSNQKTKIESKTIDVTKTRSSFQELSILPDVSMTDLHNILSTVSQQKSTSVTQTPDTMHGKSQPSSTSGNNTDRKNAKDDSLRKSSQKSSKDMALSSSMTSRSTSDVPETSLRDENPMSGIEVPSEETQKRLKSAQKKLTILKSVYEDLKAPLSPFEREALMLGIPDENVEHRHVNQMLIRGENVVLVSIIDD